MRVKIDKNINIDENNFFNGGFSFAATVIISLALIFSAILGSHEDKSLINTFVTKNIDLEDSLSLIKSSVSNIFFNN